MFDINTGSTSNYILLFWFYVRSVPLIYGTSKIGWQNSALDRTSILFIKFQFYCGRFAALQNWGIKKDVQITTCKDLAETFTRLVHHETEGYDEVKLIFDHYQENSVKGQTRNKSTQGNQTRYKIKNDTNLHGVTMKKLLSNVLTKQDLTEFLGNH